MKKITITGLIFLLSVLSVAQSPQKIRKMEGELSKASGTQRMHLLKKLADIYSDSVSDLAIAYAAQYLKLAEINHSIADEAEARMIFSNIYHYQVSYRKSLESEKKAAAAYLSIGDSTGFYTAQRRIGNSYLFLHAYDSAMMFTRDVAGYFLRIADTLHYVTARLQMAKILTRQSRNHEAVAMYRELLHTIDGTSQRGVAGWLQYWLAQSEMNLGNFRSADSVLRSSINNYDQAGDIQGKLGSMQLLGEVYLILGKNARAYEIFFESYKKRHFVKGTVRRLHFLAQYHLNMGRIFFNTTNYPKALEEFDTVEKLVDRYKFHDIEAENYVAIGRTKFKMQHYDEALALYEKAYSIQLNRKNIYDAAMILNNIGGVYQMQGKYKLAVSTYRRALTSNRNIGNKFGVAQNEKNMATCYTHLGRYSEAKASLDDGMDAALESDVKNLILNYYRNYISFYTLTGNPAGAEKYFGRYLTLSEQISFESTRDMTDLLMRIYNNEIQAKTMLLEQQLNIQELENERNDLYIKQILAFSALIVTILLLITILYINKIKTARKLEKVVADRTRILKENHRKLIESNHTKDKFYSIIAHDLKSPFNSLIGFSNLLNDDYADFSDKERLQFISIIRNASEEMYELLENLLDWARNSSGDLEFKPIKLDLAQVTRQVMLLQEKNARIKDIRIVNDVPKNTFAIADENMIRTVVRNLVSNAIKFTGQGGQIVLHARQNDTKVIYAVQDNGVGISNENLKKLFTVHKKVRKKGTANEKGTGLGLLLCRDFVEINGGSLSIESEPGEGSTFSFSLPTKKNTHDE